MSFAVKSHQLPQGSRQVKAYAQVHQTKALVEAKLQEMKSVDETPKDLAPEPDRVAVCDLKLKGTGTKSFLGLKKKEKFTGHAEFQKDGSPKAMQLESDKNNNSYRFEQLEDGSKVYAAPDTNKADGQHQVVVEKPDGTLFIDETFGRFVDSTIGGVKRDVTAESVRREEMSASISFADGPTGVASGGGLVSAVGTHGLIAR